MVSLGDFHPDESGVPCPFIQKSIIDIHLGQLRKRCKHGEYGVDELATMNIQIFCLPEARYLRTGNSATSCDHDIPMAGLDQK